jgi:predicted aspartyl protease
MSAVSSAKLAMLLHLAGIVAFTASVGPGGKSNCAANGDIAFRKSDFAHAESLYRRALAEDNNCARAVWGLGRIEELNFRRAAARDNFACAFRLDPRDPKIIRSYASVVTDPAAEALLLRNYIAVGGEGVEGAESALGHIQLHQRLGTRDVDALATPYQSYTLPMSPSYPGSSRPAGMVLRVILNGGKPLRLLFDTGARGIVIRSKAAEKLGLEFLASSLVRGVGAGEPAKAWIGLAQSLRIENLKMRNCLIEVSSGLPPGDDDGVIGAAMFQRFLIRFNAGEKLLELLPFTDPMTGPFKPEQPWHGHDRIVAPEMEQFTKARQVGHLLLVAAKVDRERFGYFLLDTGAAFSSLSLELARPGRGHSSVIPVSGLSGGAAGAIRLSPVQFEMARGSMVDADPVAFDLREISRQEGVEISGLIGFPAISQGILTINYRDGLIDIARRK